MGQQATVAVLEYTFTTLLSWIMRPQRELNDAIASYGEQLGVSGAESRHRYIGMHLRRGDKYALSSRHLKDHAWRIAPRAFKTWGQRLAASLGMDKVLYMTDDKSVTFAEPGDAATRLFYEAPTVAACMTQNVELVMS